MTTKVPVELSSTPGIVDGSNATAITIDSSENVGIGTASPAAELHVSAATTTQVRCESTTNSSTSTFQLATNGSDWNLSAGGSSQGTYPNSFYIYDAGADATRLIIDSAGHVTMPSQPAFNVTKNGYQANLAINSTTTVTWETEIFDQNADFASNTFTAPVTGRYQFNVSMRLQSVDSAAAYYQTHLQTSNRNYEIDLLDPTEFNGDLNYYTVKGSILADMDAGDTAVVSIHQADGTAQTDVSYSADTHWSGFLVC